MHNLPVVVGSLSGWQITGIVVGVLVLIVVAMTFKDIIRYIKISSM
jgi:hypothetical protein